LRPHIATFAPSRAKEAGYGLAEAASATGNHYRFSGKEICAIDRRQSLQFIIGKTEMGVLGFHVRRPSKTSVTQ
jgi:hypothetical protein